jgi:hypothetical protein
MAIKQFLFQSAEGYADTAGLDAETQLAFVKLTGIADPVFPADGDIALDVSGRRIVGLADPVRAGDAANKNYVDNAQAGLIVKEPARVLPTGNVTISAPGTTLDGVTPLVVGDRVLLVNQTLPKENGIYVWQGAAVAMTRAPDANSSSTLKSGTYVFIDEGTVNADSAWVLSTDGVINVGTTDQLWIQFSGLGQITPGLGLTKSGNTLDVGAGDGILVYADNIELSLDSNPALALNGTSPTKKLAWFPDTTQGLDKGIGGAFIKLPLANAGLQFNGSGELDARLDGSGGLLKDALGLGVKIFSINELTKSASGLAVVGVPAGFKIDGVAVGTTVTAANLNTVTNGSNADLMHVHAPPTWVPYVKEDWTALNNISKGDGVYIAGNNVVSKGDASSDGASRIIGVAETDIFNGADGKVIMTGTLAGVLTGASAGTRYFLGTDGQPTLIGSLPARARTVQLGIAKNTTDLSVRVFDFGKKA